MAAFTCNDSRKWTPGVLSFLQHVSAWRWRDRCVGRAAERRRRFLLPGAGSEPPYPVRPPAILMMFGAIKPFVCALHRLLVSPVALALAGRINDSGDVTTSTQHKAYRTANKL